MYCYHIDQLAQMGYNAGMSGSLLAVEEKGCTFAADFWYGLPASIGRIWTLLY